MKKNSGFQSTTNYMDEFNTEDTEGLESNSGNEERENFAALLNDSLKSETKKLRVGDKIRAKILNIGATDVFVTTGTRKDGVMLRSEFLDAEGNLIYKAGDVTDAYITLVKGDDIRLSRNVTGQAAAEDLKSAYENNLPIQGRIVEVVKGGVRVNIKGKLAFCPISQIDSKHIETPDEYVGKSFDFKITEITEGGKNIVVSRRKLLDAEREVGTTSFLSEKKDGDVVTGRVTRFEPFGAFVELAPGVDGLIHISEIAWSRIGSPEEVLVLGQDVTVKLLKRELVNGRAKISLSLKQVTPREVVETEATTPKKEDAMSKFSVGQVFTGKVTRKEVYGLFVQLEPGATGLLHKSRLETHHGFPFEKIRVNDPVTVQIVEIKPGDRQISLGLPGDSAEDDWKANYKNDSGKSLGTLADRMGAALAKKTK